MIGRDMDMKGNGCVAVYDTIPAFPRRRKTTKGLRIVGV
jgi:hypothetical protein